MSTPFTPGPWATGTRDVSAEWGGVSYFRVVLPNGDVWECQSTHFSSPLTEVQRANTHLMAAAPEMYEALKCIADEHAAFGALTPDAIQRAARALAKAVQP